MTPEGLKLIKDFEGLRLTAYPDPGTGGDPWTVGYGHTGPGVHPGMTITEAQAEEYLLQDLRTAQDAINRLVLVPLSPAQKDALTSFVFNIGGGKAFANSTLLRKLNARDYKGAADQLLRWDKAGGKVLAGLSRRRRAERELFLSDIPPEPMIPFVAAALPSIISAVPDLIKIFGDRSRESTQQYADAASRVVDIAVQATNAANAQDAVERMNADPSAAEAVRSAIRDRWFDLVEVGPGIKVAREENLKASGVPLYKQPAFVVSILLLPLVYYVAAVVLQFGDFSQETKAMVVAAIITGVLGGITGFFLGSSVSSRAKDEVLMRAK